MSDPELELSPLCETACIRNGPLNPVNTGNSKVRNLDLFPFPRSDRSDQSVIKETHEFSEQVLARMSIH